MAPRDNTLDINLDLNNTLQQSPLLLQVSWFVAAGVIFGSNKASHVNWVVAPISSTNKGLKTALTSWTVQICLSAEVLTPPPALPDSLYSHLNTVPLIPHLF